MMSVQHIPGEDDYVELRDGTVGVVVEVDADFIWVQPLDVSVGELPVPWERERVVRTFQLDPNPALAPPTESSQLEAAIDSLTTLIGRAPTVEELGLALQLAPDEIQHQLADKKYADVALESGLEIERHLVKVTQPEYVDDAFDDAKWLDKELDQLTSRELRVLEMYFGLRGERKRTIGEIAAELRQNLYRVRKIKAGALGRIERHLVTLRRIMAEEESQPPP